jgi:uncharacterized repeat protein (TIGR03803 family)
MKPQTSQRLTASLFKVACLALALLTAMAISSSAQTLTTLVDFDGTNGSFPPRSSLVRGANAHFYGTTSDGGANSQGTVFEITAGGTLTTLYSFCAQVNCADGYYPRGGLVLASNGNFYGTTYYGGANGAGTIYEITSNGTFSVLYNFCSQVNCADGGNPLAGLIYYDGTFYGTTSFGGATFSGTVFSITTSGQFAALYSFCSQTNCDDGTEVNDRLIRGSNGSFYGVTLSGGANGWGTVFAVTAKGKLTTLHSFAFTDGANPFSGLVQASDEDLYGTTQNGGNANNGTVFKITTAGKLTSLYSFCTATFCTDGSTPWGTLIQGSNGDLYGTTVSGGTAHLGTVYEITTSGKLTTLYSFSGTNGASPDDGVVQGSNGDFYGTTNRGGDLSCTVPPGGCGTVFSLTP